MIIEFTIFGNHLDKLGNPAAYHSAQKTKVVTITKDQFGREISRTVRSYPNKDKQVTKYHDYCQHVRNTLAVCLKEYRTIRNTLLAGDRIQIAENIKTQLYQLNMIYFKHDLRADAENVSKGVIDAIHAQDKYVHGAFPWTFDKERPRVEVLITDDWKIYDARHHQFYADRDAGKLF